MANLILHDYIRTIQHRGYYITARRNCKGNQFYWLWYKEPAHFKKAKTKPEFVGIHIDAFNSDQDLISWASHKIQAFEAAKKAEWDLVAEYCDNDVIATEALWKSNARLLTRSK